MPHSPSRLACTLIANASEIYDCSNPSDGVCGGRIGDTVRHDRNHRYHAREYRRFSAASASGLPDHPENVTPDRRNSRSWIEINANLRESNPESVDSH